MGRTTATTSSARILVSGQKVTVGHRTVDEWFSPNAFTEAVGHFGDIPRNPSGVSAPVNNPVTLAINRSFSLPLEGNHIKRGIAAYEQLENRIIPLKTSFADGDNRLYHSPFSSEKDEDWNRSVVSLLNR